MWGTYEKRGCDAALMGYTVYMGKRKCDAALMGVPMVGEVIQLLWGTDGEDVMQPL